jgi:hypothetical protein
MNVSEEHVTSTFTLKMGPSSSSETLIIIYHTPQHLTAKEYNIILMILGTSDYI